MKFPPLSPSRIEEIITRFKCTDGRTDEERYRKLAKELDIHPGTIEKYVLRKQVSDLQKERNTFKAEYERIQKRIFSSLEIILYTLGILCLGMYIGTFL